MEQEWITGKNPVIEALRAGRSMEKIWIQKGAQKGQMKQVFSLAKEAGLVIQEVPKQKLDQLTDQAHQGVAALVAAYVYSSIDDILKRAADRGEPPFLLLLDELEDPHNLGSILRTADASGVHGVIIPKRRAVGLTQTVAKTATGALEYVPVARVTNLSRTIEDLKKQGVWIAGTAAEAEADYRTLDAGLPLGLVIGNEGKGMSRIVREKCDFLIRLPMVGHVSSLNASVAASLLMYEVYRKRHPLGE
ncbi:23S rRNA (guanosine(2251)-2'-O)-methyltransferase RlmB [Bacillaceae bacterium SIJ1]|uniref:23S rRNA (guanosine(2251)-2'-O)-methyltransferase RlmB n=1 Tax=Litoribacterium kuwaitense TaxID=1398745 RepID=UPI0013EBF947|nr:23S rRNA (guanosine(2251)-2'-O)-methyltransferase RlmB [Litoribacterium kuwaitense]NGP45824.1 23S rRNA (guanosine(2251)-2'-O)-methyltransferase RlmB [Litoribacterium kuwaitense]